MNKYQRNTYQTQIPIKYKYLSNTNTYLGHLHLNIGGKTKLKGMGNFVVEALPLTTIHTP